ncbi:DUF1236 domain-containing protein [Bosea sp. BK604]|uniref:DUF1236 domain-containing protein n=1 Tax=Bosea sp. BK604 TaxID=2512180 RepID=UPI0010496AFE|nr:DUF1236 domain-containing protein [Bosea sp. BK604]TCR64757.1 uncharacterized protein DUF1236 [Bosea sp. BK604]
MMKKLAFAAVLAVLPVTAFAQSSGVVVRDPTGGSTRDPALGVGTVEVPLTRDPAGGTMVDDTPRFRTYVMEQHLPSYSYAPPMAVGTVLPDDGVVYREVPVEYGAQGYRYTVVNGRTVLVEPGTRRIVQIIN